SRRLGCRRSLNSLMTQPRPSQADCKVIARSKPNVSHAPAKTMPVATDTECRSVSHLAAQALPIAQEAQIVASPPLATRNDHHRGAPWETYRFWHRYLCCRPWSALRLLS